MKIGTMNCCMALFIVLASVVDLSRGLPALAAQMCSDVLGLDCSTDYIVHGDEVLCGTDGVTYQNKCFHVQAQCNDVTINKAYDGKCKEDVTTNAEITPTAGDITPTAGDITSTKSSEETSTTSAFDLQLNEQFCNTSQDEPCPSVLDPLCGTDFKFYQNMCEFQKVKCVDRDVQLQSLSNCKDGKQS